MDIGIIGGADGPTAIYIAGSPWPSIITGVVIAAAIVLIIIYRRRKRNK